MTRRFIIRKKITITKVTDAKLNRSYALMKRLDYAQDLALMKKASDKKHNSTKYSALQSIDVHWFFIERTEICQLSWIGRSDEHLA